MNTVDSNSNFEPKIIKHELQHLICGNGGARQGSLIKATARYVGGSNETSDSPQRMERTKEQETKDLIEYIDNGRV